MKMMTKVKTKIIKMDNKMEMYNKESKLKIQFEINQNILKRFLKIKRIIVK